MEFVSHLPSGPWRDHAVVRDSSTVATLDMAAAKAMLYRSAEQSYTDKRQAMGYTALGPVAFGTFECGRSSMPGNVKPTAVFKDGIKRGTAGYAAANQIKKEK